MAKSNYKQPFDPEWPHGHTYWGYNLRILCKDAKGDRPIVALVDFGTHEEVRLFNEEGKSSYDGCRESITNAPKPKREWWINVYKEGQYTYSTKEEADKYAFDELLERVKVVEVED